MLRPIIQTHGELGLWLSIETPARSATATIIPREDLRLWLWRSTAVVAPAMPLRPIIQTHEELGLWLSIERHVERLLVYPATTDCSLRE